MATDAQRIIRDSSFVPSGYCPWFGGDDMIPIAMGLLVW